MSESEKALGKPESSQLKVGHLRALVEASKILNSTLDLNRLLGLILEVATNELKADRGTLFLVDKEAGELRARISQGLDSRVLRVKIGQGLSGSVAASGETIRIEDAYKDSRFDPSFDKKSGYITRSILTVPIRSKPGDIIGVIQLLNKINGTFVLQDQIFLEALAVHFAIALENAKLHSEVRDQERIHTELELARQIQQNLLRPPPAVWRRYRMAAKANTCYEVGGDFYDFLHVSDTTLWTVIADVSGKGISSALVVSTLQATLHALLVGVHSFERLLVKLNEQIREFTGGSKYLTLFLVLLDSESNRIHYINAGHNPPLLVRADGSHELLHEGGTVLGLIPNVRYDRAHVDLRPGDLLVLYTDGIVEAEDKAENMFGVDGLLRCLRDAGPAATPEELVTRILNDVREFAADVPQSDDQSLVVISPQS